MEKYVITRIMPGSTEKVVDVIAQEVPLTIYINGKETVTLLASPDALTELSVGFMLSSGFVSNFDEIETIKEDGERWNVSVVLKDTNFDADSAFKRMYTSGCGRGILFYTALDLSQRGKLTSSSLDFIHRDRVFGLMAEFQTMSVGFKETGGVHSAALADSTHILVVREDIGRHNTIDKVLGYALMNNVDLSDKIILSSGRVSSEILLKIKKTSIGMVISRSAPTNQAINHARDSGITLIGFVRGKRMNIYSGWDRILS